MKALAGRIARWFGLDGNPLRRRTDKMESAWRIILIAAFCIGAPLMAGVVGGSVRATSQHEVAREASWRQADAVLLQGSPQPYYAYGSMATYWVQGRWRTASGTTEVGKVPAPAGAVSGATIPVWLDSVGQPMSRVPMTADVVAFRVVLAEMATVLGLGIALLLIAVTVRWQLNRRRIAYWTTEWSAFGPRWTSRRQSGG